MIPDALVYNVGGVALLTCIVGVANSLFPYLDTNVTIGINFDGSIVGYDEVDNTSSLSITYYRYTHQIVLSDLYQARLYYCSAHVTVSPPTSVIFISNVVTNGVIMRGECVSV